MPSVRHSKTPSTIVLFNPETPNLTANVCVPVLTSKHPDDTPANLLNVEVQITAAGQLMARKTAQPTVTLHSGGSLLMTYLITLITNCIFFMFYYISEKSSCAVVLALTQHSAHNINKTKQSMS